MHNFSICLCAQISSFHFHEIKSTTKLKHVYCEIQRVFENQSSGWGQMIVITPVSPFHCFATIESCRYGKIRVWLFGISIQLNLTKGHIFLRLVPEGRVCLKSVVVIYRYGMLIFYQFLLFKLLFNILNLIHVDSVHFMK